MTLNKIFSAIHDLDVHELRHLNSVVITEINHRQRQLAHAFRIGDHVEFTHSKTGEVYSGQVFKIAQINVSILTSKGARWRVSPSLLRRANPEDRKRG